MKNYSKYLIFCVAFVLLVNYTLWAQKTNPFAVYVGTSPCGNIIKPLLGVKEESECDFTKWILTLYPQKVNDPAPAKLVYRYGVSKPNSSGFTDEKKVEFEGHWTIQKGAYNKPNAIVYQITLHHVDKNLLFVELSDNAIHMLDGQRKLMIGNAGYSYTFSKAKP